MADSILKNCSVSVNANCIIFENDGKRSMIRFHNKDIQYIAHLADRNWTSSAKIKYLHIDELCLCFKCFVEPSVDEDSFLHISCSVYEKNVKHGMDVDFSIFYELSGGKKKIETAMFKNEMKSNEIINSVVSEIKRHMLIHEKNVESGLFTSEYMETITYITAVYILCVLDTLAKQGQIFKEDPKFDNDLYHVDRFSMIEQSNELVEFINGVLG